MQAVFEGKPADFGIVAMEYGRFRPVIVQKTQVGTTALLTFATGA